MTEWHKSTTPFGQMLRTDTRVLEAFIRETNPIAYYNVGRYIGITMNNLHAKLNNVSVLMLDPPTKHRILSFMALGYVLSSQMGEENREHVLNAVERVLDEQALGWRCIRLMDGSLTLFDRVTCRAIGMLIGAPIGLLIGTTAVRLLRWVGQRRN